MNISAHMYFAEGTESQEKEVISTIRNDWKGTIGGYTVQTNVVGDSWYRPGDAIVAIDSMMTRSVTEQGGTWMFLNPNSLGDAGHEFGHLLGLDDGYEPKFINGTEHDLIKPFVDSNDIMYDGQHGVVTDRDIRAVQELHPQN